MKIHRFITLSAMVVTALLSGGALAQQTPVSTAPSPFQSQHTPLTDDSTINCGAGCANSGVGDSSVLLGSPNADPGDPPPPAPVITYKTVNTDLGCTGGWVGQRIWAIKYQSVDGGPWTEVSRSLVSDTCHDPGDNGGGSGNPPPPPAPTLEGQMLTWTNGWTSDSQCGVSTTQIHVTCSKSGLFANGLDGGIRGPASASYSATLVSGTTRMPVSVSCSGSSGGVATDFCANNATYVIGGKTVGISLEYDTLFHKDCGANCAFTVTAEMLVH